MRAAPTACMTMLAINRLASRGPGAEISVEYARYCPAPSFAEMEIEVSIGLRSSSNFYAGFNPSEISGVFIATYHKLDVGTPVAVTIRLPTGHVLRAIGAVEWSCDRGFEDHGVRPGMGIRFQPLEGEARKVVSAFTDLRAPLFYDVED